MPTAPRVPEAVSVERRLRLLGADGHDRSCCAHCATRIKPPLARKRCKGCHAVFYCGDACQHDHGTNGDHDVYCSVIGKGRNAVQSQARKLRKCKRPNPFMFTEQGVDLFAPEYIGCFWGLLPTRPYMLQRFALADSLMWCAVKDDSDLAAEMALEHCLDMMWLNRSDNIGQRFFIPSAYLSLGRAQEAYDFL